MTLGIATVAALYAAFLLVGWYASRRVAKTSVDDLLVAGRQMSWWLAALTMTATWVDGGYLLGTVEGTYKGSVQIGAQGGVGFGLSLILGGLLFASSMRAAGFTTLIDLFDARFGQRWAAVLSLPALLGELFWSAELLVAIGATFGVMLGVDLTSAILWAAAITTLYTAVGGLWSVAYTDVLQLALVAIGLAVAIPYVLDGVGGLAHAWTAYSTARPDGSALLPPSLPSPAWTRTDVVGWWDVSAMLVFGGIPWNCYFQRVLSCRTPKAARDHSLVAGALTIILTIPPLVMGVAAFSYPWSTDMAARLASGPADTMPLLFTTAVPPLVGLLGLAAIVGAVTSSFSASILSAGSMLGWNGVRRLVWPSLSPVETGRVVRVSVWALAAVATALALKVRSVQALWFFTSDLVFVLLFPQLLWALRDPKANRIGSVAAFSLSALIRVSAGEPLLSVPAVVPALSAWPFRAIAAGVGLFVLPVVSRLTSHWDMPRPLPVANHRVAVSLHS